ncbi:hypothetical protein ACWGH5_14445 [Streptomyces sp. NPDC054864]
MSRKSPAREEVGTRPVLAMTTAALSGAVGAVIAWLLDAIPWP